MFKITTQFVCLTTLFQVHGFPAGVRHSTLEQNKGVNSTRFWLGEQIRTRADYGQFLTPTFNYDKRFSITDQSQTGTSSTTGGSYKGFNFTSSWVGEQIRMMAGHGEFLTPTFNHDKHFGITDQPQTATLYTKGAANQDAPPLSSHGNTMLGNPLCSVCEERRSRNPKRLKECFQINCGKSV